MTMTATGVVLAVDGNRAIQLKTQQRENGIKKRKREVVVAVVVEEGESTMVTTTMTTTMTTHTG